MNDKCAAGTGRFLEIMASALGYSMSDFISAAADAKDEQSINTTCTVFAESEVISLVNRGISREAIARGIRRESPEIETVLLPVADGGEGTVEAVRRAFGGELVTVTVHDPLMREIEAARRGYEDWWQALGWVREGLIAGGMLREVEVTAAMPKVQPWK